MSEHNQSAAGAVRRATDGPRGPRRQPRAELVQQTARERYYQPRTGQRCGCRRGQERDNCPQCEGTGWRIDFAAIRARSAPAPQVHNEGCDGAYCRTTKSEIRKLPYGSDGGNLLLCRACYENQMGAWRLDGVKELPTWESLEVYP